MYTDVMWSAHTLHSFKHLVSRRSPSNLVWTSTVDPILTEMTSDVDTDDGEGSVSIDGNQTDGSILHDTTENNSFVHGNNQMENSNVHQNLQPDMSAPICIPKQEPSDDHDVFKFYGKPLLMFIIIMVKIMFLFLSVVWSSIKVYIVT